MIQPLAPRLRAFGEWATSGTLARSPRARAAQRRAVMRATRIGALATITVAGFDAVVLPAIHPSGGPQFLAASSSLAVVGLLALVVLPRMRRHPEPVAFCLALVAGIITQILAVVVPDAAPLLVSCLLLLPGVVALVVPWRTTTHVTWLAVFAIITFLFLAGPAARSLDHDDRRDQVVAAVLAIAFSLLGHLLIQRSRLRFGAQLERGRALRRETIGQRAEIDHLYAELLHTARIDPLTRVGNRLLLDEDLKALASRLDRSGGMAGVLAIDIDRFKKVNDRLGHEAGDRVLAAVAQLLRARLRASDAIYRYGGDEFVVLIQDGSTVVLATMAERLRHAVEVSTFAGVAAPLTVSIGSASITAADLHAGDASWFRAADAALYRAKTTGRNLTEAAEASGRLHGAGHNRESQRRERRTPLRVSI